jgi:hypothetical protein
LTRPLSGAYRQLEVGQLSRAGALQDGATGSLRWADGGEIGIVGGEDRIELVYRATLPGADESEDVRQTVWIQRTSCNYGGARPWFLCPQCHRRALKLYGGPRFLCRICAGFAYASQRESDMDRFLTRAQAIRARLGGTGDVTELFPPKPKGMHWRTYERLRDESERASFRSLQMAVARFGRFV